MSSLFKCCRSSTKEPSKTINSKEQLSKPNNLAISNVREVVSTTTLNLEHVYANRSNSPFIADHVNVITDEAVLSASGRASATKTSSLAATVQQNALENGIGYNGDRYSLPDTIDGFDHTSESSRYHPNRQSNPASQSPRRGKFNDISPEIGTDRRNRPQKPLMMANGLNESQVSTTRNAPPQTFRNHQTVHSHSSVTTMLNQNGGVLQNSGPIAIEYGNNIPLASTHSNIEPPNTDSGSDHNSLPRSGSPSLSRRTLSQEELYKIMCDNVKRHVSPDDSVNLHHHQQLNKNNSNNTNSNSNSKPIVIYADDHRAPSRGNEMFFPPSPSRIGSSNNGHRGGPLPVGARDSKSTLLKPAFISSPLRSNIHQDSSYYSENTPSFAHLIGQSDPWIQRLEIPSSELTAWVHSSTAKYRLNAATNETVQMLGLASVSLSNNININNYHINNNNNNSNQQQQHIGVGNRSAHGQPSASSGLKVIIPSSSHQPSPSIPSNNFHFSNSNNVGLHNLHQQGGFPSQHIGLRLVQQPNTFLGSDQSSLVSSQAIATLVQGIEDGGLGDGAAATVYRAVWKGSPVAVKSLKRKKISNVGADGLAAEGSQWWGDRNEIERRKFWYELIILSRLRHPGIVMLMGVCTDYNNNNNQFSFTINSNNNNNNNNNHLSKNGPFQLTPNHHKNNNSVGGVMSSPSSQSSGALNPASTGTTMRIITEVCEGGSLFKLLHEDRYKALSTGHIVDAILQLARAIAYLHEAVRPPVAHRDIKSLNILLAHPFLGVNTNTSVATVLNGNNQFGGGGAAGAHNSPSLYSNRSAALTDNSSISRSVVASTAPIQLKLADLGLARASDLFDPLLPANPFETAPPNTILAQQPGGTLSWMAPECLALPPGVCLSTETELLQADVYSFGMVAYELLSRKIPYFTSHVPPGLKRDTAPPIDGGEGANASSRTEWINAVVKGVLSGDRPPLQQFAARPGIVRGLADIIRRCWSQNGSERPRIGQVVSELELLASCMNGVEAASILHESESAQNHNSTSSVPANSSTGGNLASPIVIPSQQQQPNIIVPPLGSTSSSYQFQLVNPHGTPGVYGQSQQHFQPSQNNYNQQQMAKQSLMQLSPLSANAQRSRSISSNPHQQSATNLTTNSKW